MSGPTTYIIGLTSAEREWIEKTAKERCELAKYGPKLADYQNKIKISVYGDNVTRIKADKMQYKELKADSGHAAYDEALEKYARICTVLDIEMSEGFEYDEEYCKELTEKLVEETQRLEELHIKRLQDEHVYNITLDVLKDMGYDLIGTSSKTKKNGVTVKSTLLALDEDTAVNLVTTSDGKYTFEFVGIDHDNIPVTEARISELFKFMKTMCRTEFNSFNKKMEEHGIILKDIIERPPDRAYCSFKNVETECKRESEVLEQRKEAKASSGKV